MEYVGLVVVGLVIVGLVVYVRNKPKAKPKSPPVGGGGGSPNESVNVRPK